MTRADRIVIAVVAALALASWPAALLANGALSPLRTVTITGPAGVSRLPLDRDAHVEVRGLTGTVTVRVAHGTVAVAESSCPDRSCVRQGAVSSGAIVCVPNGVTVRVGGDADALDACVR